MPGRITVEGDVQRLAVGWGPAGDGIWVPRHAVPVIGLSDFDKEAIVKGGKFALNEEGTAFIRKVKNDQDKISK